MSTADWFPLYLSLKVALVATLLALVAGFAIAWWFAHRRVIGKEWLDALLTLPMVMPPTVLGYYLIVCLGRRSWLGNWLEQTLGLRLIFTWQGAVVAAAIVAFPLIFKAARAAFEDIDPRLEDAARTLGVGEWGVFFRVSLPLATRGVLAGTLLAFARAMGEFGATLMIAGNLPGRTQTLSMAVYEAVQSGDDGRANALVLVMSVVCVMVLVISSRLLSPRRAA